jgi:hypothetical protein
VLQLDSRHIDGALMMGNHALGEIPVGIAGQRDIHVHVHLFVGLPEFVGHRVAGGGHPMPAMVLSRRLLGQRRCC